MASMRIKTVFPYDELARVWLRQGQDTGRSPGERMCFIGDTIYSYGPHFPIARLFDAPNGEQVILFTTDTYSRTTLTHIRAVSSAIRNSHRRTVLCAYPQAVASAEQHDINLDCFKQAKDYLAQRHAKARKPELYSGGIKTEARQAREYCEVMCIPVPVWAMLPASIEAGKPLMTALEFYREKKPSHDRI